MPKERPADILEREIQKTISECSALKRLGEEGHFEAVEEALECILEGVSMRLHEIRSNNEDSDD